MNVFKKAKQSIAKTKDAENKVGHYSSAYPWYKNTTLKRFVFDYTVTSTDVNGKVCVFLCQKEINAKHLQGAIRKLYLEAEPGFTGLKKIIWEDA